MLSELQRQRVWEAWLSAEIRANYFAELSGHYARLQRHATWLTLLLSSGAALSLVAKALPAAWAWVVPLLVFATAALSLYSLVMQNQKNAIDSADLHLRWNSLARDYAALWDDMYSEDAVSRLGALEQRELEASKSGTAFPVKHDRLLKWQEHVERHHMARRAA